jgi:sphinganine C4-monooxygenase
MALNSTRPFNVYESHLLRNSHPFYYSTKPVLITGLTDAEFALALPLLAYWGLSFLFQLLDSSTAKWVEKYRIHESAEITKRNRATKLQVVLAVLGQQFIQTFMGYIFISDDAENCGGSVTRHLGAIQAQVPTLQWLVRFVFGSQFGSHVWDQKAEEIVYYSYWWAKPILQFFFAM